MARLVVGPSSAGYVALLRLLFRGNRYPRAISGDAAEFFWLGPGGVRELRLRHGVRARTLSRADWERLLRAGFELCLRSHERLLRR